MEPDDDMIGFCLMEKKQDGSIEVSTTEARSGVTGHGVRYVLAISLALVVVAMGAALLMIL